MIPIIPTADEDVSRIRTMVTAMIECADGQEAKNAFAAVILAATIIGREMNVNDAQFHLTLAEALEMFPAQAGTA